MKDVLDFLPQHIKDTDVLDDDTKLVLANLLYSFLRTTDARTNGYLVMPNDKLEGLCHIRRETMLDCITNLELYELIRREKGERRIKGKPARASRYYFNWDNLKRPIEKKTFEDFFNEFLNPSETPMNKGGNCNGNCNDNINVNDNVNFNINDNVNFNINDNVNINCNCNLNDNVNLNVNDNINYNVNKNDNIEDIDFIKLKEDLYQYIEESIEGLDWYCINTVSTKIENYIKRQGLSSSIEKRLINISRLRLDNIRTKLKEEELNNISTDFVQVKEEIQGYTVERAF